MEGSKSPKKFVFNLKDLLNGLHWRDFSPQQASFNTDSIFLRNISDNTDSFPKLRCQNIWEIYFPLNPIIGIREYVMNFR